MEWKEFNWVIAKLFEERGKKLSSIFQKFDFRSTRACHVEIYIWILNWGGNDHNVEKQVTELYNMNIKILHIACFIPASL